MVRIRLLSYLFLAGPVFVLAAPAWAIDAAPTWEPPELVFTTKNAPPVDQLVPEFARMLGQDRYLAYDHFGRPGMGLNIHRVEGLTVDDEEELHYARRLPGSLWVTAVHDTRNSLAFSPASTFPSLAYNWREEPVISYAGASGLSLSTAGVLEQGFQLNGANSSIAIDPIGRVGIAYTLGQELVYTRDDDGDGVFGAQTPITTSFGTRYPSLAFDSTARPMIAYGDGSDGLHMATTDVGLKNTLFQSDVDPASEVTYVSLAINPATDFPAIAYNDAAADALKYAEWNGDAWDITVVDFDFNMLADASDMSVSLAFDPSDDRPAIAYTGDNVFFVPPGPIDPGGFVVEENVLRLAWLDGNGVWQKQNVHRNVNGGLVPSLAFNDFGDGFPSIAYFDDQNHVYFVHDPPLGVPEPAPLALVAIAVVSIATARPARHGCKCSTS